MYREGLPAVHGSSTAGRVLKRNAHEVTLPAFAGVSGVREKPSLFPAIHMKYEAATERILSALLTGSGFTTP